jgi:hypothetical protein
MARPSLNPDEQPVIVMVKLRLYRGQDDDLLDFFQRLPDRLRAASVKQALRSGGLPVAAEAEADEDDIADALAALLG